MSSHINTTVYGLMLSLYKNNYSLDDLHAFMYYCKANKVMYKKHNLHLINETRSLCDS